MNTGYEYHVFLISYRYTDENYQFMFIMFIYIVDSPLAGSHGGKKCSPADPWEISGNLGFDSAVECNGTITHKRTMVIFHFPWKVFHL
jgi:hypothetical protein